MKFVPQLLAAAALVAAAIPAFAATTTYTSSASFLAVVAPGSYTNTFTGVSSSAAPISFSSGGFSYTASAPSGIYSSGTFIGSNVPDEAVTLTFTSGNITAVGGNFFNTDVFDAFQATAITLTLSDGTVASYTPLSTSTYSGFASTSTITSLTFTGSAGLYPSLDNLTVGVSAVPEPATWAMMGIGMAGLMAARRRQA